MRLRSAGDYCESLSSWQLPSAFTNTLSRLCVPALMSHKQPRETTGQFPVPESTRGLQYTAARGQECDLTNKELLAHRVRRAVSFKFRRNAEINLAHFGRVSEQLPTTFARRDPILEANHLAPPAL